MLSQDGILRFIDIHACKQLFEIGGADEVHFYNDNLLLFLLPGRKIYFMILAELHNLIKKSRSYLHPHEHYLVNAT